MIYNVQRKWCASLKSLQEFQQENGLGICHVIAHKHQKERKREKERKIARKREREK